MSKQITSRWKSIRKSILAQVVMLNAEMQEIKVSDDLTLYAGDDLALDVLVFTIENEPFVNGTFEFEEKVYTTGENGEIVDIQDVSENDAEGNEDEDEKPAEDVELEGDAIDHKIDEPEPTDTPEELVEKLEEANDIIEKLQEEVMDQIVEIEELKRLNTELRTQLSAQIKKGKRRVVLIQVLRVVRMFDVLIQVVRVVRMFDVLGMFDVPIQVLCDVLGMFDVPIQVLCDVLGMFL